MTVTVYIVWVADPPGFEPIEDHFVDIYGNEAEAHAASKKAIGPSRVEARQLVAAPFTRERPSVARGQKDQSA